MLYRQSFRTGSILAAWTDLLQDWRCIFGCREHRGEGCSADCAGICAPFSVSQLLKYRVPRANFSLGIGDVILIGEGAVQSDTQIDWLVGVR